MMFRFRDWKILTKLLVVMLVLSWIPLLISLAVGIKNSVAISRSKVDNQVLRLVSSDVQDLVQQSMQFILQNHESLDEIAQNDLITEMLNTLPTNNPSQTGAPLPGTGQPPLSSGGLPPSSNTPNPGGQQQNPPVISESAAVNAYLSDIVDSNHGIELISVYDTRGTEIAGSTSQAIGANFMSRPDVTMALSGERYTERIHRGPNDLPGFFISVPVKNGDQVIGAVSARLEADFIIDELAGAIGSEGSVSRLFIVDEYGIILADSQPDSEWLFRSLVTLDPELAQSIEKGYLVNVSCAENDQACWEAALAPYKILTIPAAQPLGETIQAAFQSGQAGSMRYCYPDSVDAPLDESCKNGNWHTAAYRVVADPYNGESLFAIVADVSEATYLDAVKRQSTMSILGGLGAALLLVISSILVARSMARPIHQLSDVAEEIEQDEPFEEVKLANLSRQGDELGSLARVFSKMAVVVQERERKLKKEVRELKIMIDESKRKEEVERLTENEFFKELQTKAREMKQARKDTKKNK